MAKNKIKALQMFSDEALERSKNLTPEQILEFLDSYHRMNSQNHQGPSKLISLKVPDPLLEAFRRKAELLGVKYQTQIKELMREWVNKS